MVRSGFLLRGALVAVLGLLSSSCFAVADLDRFERAPPAAPSNFSNLKVTLRGMTSHVAERVEYRVVDASNILQSRGIIVPLGGPAAVFQVHGAVPKQNGPFRLDFFADHDLSGAYDPRPDTTLDHAWRLPLENNLLNEEGTFVIVFDHNTSFTNLNTPSPPTETGKPVTVHLKGLASLQGRRIEVRVADASNKRVVAMHRVPVLDKPEYDVLVPGMMETGVTYTVEIYTDDGRGGGIRAFRFDRACTDVGLETSFNGANPAETAGITQPTDVDRAPSL